jgi:DNA-binding PadR family transcriptional regulator
VSVPYALLGLIERKPRYGYELKQAYERLFADTRPIRVGQLYATLQRLARDGTIMLDGEEPGDAGPDRKRFSITDAGRSELDAWLAAPEPPETFLQTTLFTKVVLSQLSSRPAVELLDAQRARHLERMRELSRLKRSGSAVDALLADHALLHLEADIRWIDIAEQRLPLLDTDEEVTQP